jgi:foldase protein PrsA
MSKKIAPIIIAVLTIIAIALYFLYQRYLVAATVNGKTIGRLEVISELEKQGGKKVLDTVITQQLIRDQAKKENISVSQDELDKEMKKIEAGVVAQGGTLEGALAQQGLTKADLVKDVKLQVLVQKLAKVDQIKISDAEVEKYMKDNKAQFPANAKDKPDTSKIRDLLKQQKAQTMIQEFITALRSKAKISYFGTYK